MKDERVRRVIVYRKDSTPIECRYSVNKGLLYFQNRSKDVSMCLDDFLDRLHKTITQAKGAGLKIISDQVSESFKWSVK